MDLNINAPLLSYIVIHGSIVVLTAFGFLGAKIKLSGAKSLERASIDHIYRAEVILGRTRSTFIMTIVGELVSNLLLWMAGVFDLLII